MSRRQAPKVDQKEYDAKNLEMAVIGYALLFPHAFYDVQELQDVHFLDADRRTIFATMRRMNEKDGPSALETPSLLVTECCKAGMEEERAFAILTEARDFAPLTQAGIHPVKKAIKSDGLKRAILDAGNKMIAAVSESADGDEAATKAGMVLTSALKAGASVEVCSMAEMMEIEIAEMEAVASGQIFKMDGMRTGLTALDNLILGCHGGEMIIVAARPAVGKSSLANEFAYSFGVTQQVPGAVFSLEMKRKEWAQRLVSSRAKCDIQKVRARLLNPDQRNRYIAESKKINQNARFYVQDQGGLTMAKIGATITRLYHECGLKWAIIDYIQLIDHCKMPGESDNSAIGRTSQAIKALANNLGIPIIALSQLNRDSEKRDNKRPRVSELRDSGSLEQDADIILLLYRESMHYSEEERSRHAGTDWEVAEIIVGKQRNGPLGTARVKFTTASAAFSDLPDDHGAGTYSPAYASNDDELP